VPEIENIESFRFRPPEFEARVTPVGRVLRLTSLDEVPNLLNVISGDMHLVGPRPDEPEIVARYRPEYHCRHRVKPGITGWAQVNGWRGDTSIARRIECDLYYLKNWSFGLDLKILWLTVWRGFRDKNAY